MSSSFPSPQSQMWNPALYDKQHSYVYTFGEDLLGLLLPQPGELILDVGCGNGHLTRRIGESGAHVIGIDASTEMIAAAVKTPSKVLFKQADAANFSFPQSFDAVFSNAALHWVLEAENAVICMARALKPGGRFVVEFGGQGNVGRIRNSIERILRDIGQERPDPVWYFPSVGAYTVLLERHGLLVRSAWLFDRPTQMEGGDQGLQSWLEMFGGPLLNQLTADLRQQVIRLAEEELRPHLYKNGSWFVDYRRLRIVAAKL